MGGRGRNTSACAAGDTIARLGGRSEGASVTLTAAELLLPATSLAVAVSVFGPAASVSPQPKLPPETVPGRPLQDTAPTPESASPTVPVSASDGVVTLAPSAGAVIATSGG